MKRSLIVLLGVVLSIPVFAHSFNYEYKGQTLIYEVISESDKTCQVTGPAGNAIYGEVAIPSNVSDGSSDYIVTTIGVNAFSQYFYLTSVDIPNSVTVIENYAFWSCVHLKSIKIPVSVTSIGRQAFEGCGFTSITIPKAVNNIGFSSFNKCFSLIEINVEEDNPNYSSINGVLLNKDCTTLLQYPGGLTGEYVIPNSVTTIGENAFNDCMNLTSVIIPNSVEIIDDFAFSYCSNLTTVYIPNSVKTIGSWAFGGCSKLTSINIPNSVINIGDGAFSDCANLVEFKVDESSPNFCSVNGVLFNRDCTTIIRLPPGMEYSEYVIPNTVTTIGNGAFNYCLNLHTVIIPNSVTTIENNAFDFCCYLNSMEIPNYVTYIGDLAFCNCLGLSTIDIPNSVTHIGHYAFALCGNLTSVTFPYSVTTIGYQAFTYCNSLTAVYYNAQDPLEFDSNIFDADTYSTATLYVPAGAGRKCKNINPWMNFNSIENFDFDGIEDISVDIDLYAPCEVFTLGGIKVADSLDNLSSGVYLVRQGNAVKKIAVK